MPNRIIKESINESRSLSELSFFAEDLFKRLITYADDYGRFNADYQIILARLYPREMQIVSESDIEDALIELSGAGKIGFYTSNPRKEIYGCFPNWSVHQRVRDSKNKFPDPDDTSINDWYLRRFIPMKLKQLIIERDGFKCRLCGKYISTIQDSRRLIKMGAGLYHIDHIIPVNQGGRAEKDNLQLTCPCCSLSRKKLFSVEEILEMTLGGEQEKTAADCGEQKKVAADCGLNPIQSESNPKRNTSAYAIKAVRRFEEFWSAYPNKQRRHLAEQAYCNLLISGTVTEDQLVLAAVNYAAYIKDSGDRVFLPNNFLDKCVFEDYLEAKPGKAPKKEGEESKPEEELVGENEEWWRYGPNGWEE